MKFSRKMLCLIISLTICLYFCSCDNSSKKQSKIAINTSKILMECIKSKDKERLKNLYAPYVNNHYDLDKDIDVLFAVFDSPVDLKGQTRILASNEKIRDGKTKQSHMSVIIDSIKLANNNCYAIAYSYNVVNRNDTKVGLICIRVFVEDEEGMLGDKVCVVGTEEIIE